MPARLKPAIPQFASLVCYCVNDYSVPAAYGHREVLLKGFVHEAVIVCGGEVIAQHGEFAKAMGWAFYVQVAANAVTGFWPTDRK